MIFLAKLNWIVLSLLSASFDSGVHLLSKRELSKSGQYLVPAVLCLTSGFFCFLLLAANGFPSVGWDYLEFVLFVGVIGALGMICFMSGLEQIEVSYAVPLLCFTPLLSAVWSWFLIGEGISPLGLLGVAIVMTGAYMLELHRMTEGIFSPIKAIFNNFSARLILAASVLWSVTSVTDKIGVLKGGAVMWSFSMSICMGVLILAAGFAKKKIDLNTLRTASWKVLPVLGICYALMHVSQMLAIETGVVSYVLSLKRLSILISVVVGSLVFKEQQLKERLLASSVMICGVLIIIFCS